MYYKGFIISILILSLSFMKGYSQEIQEQVDKEQELKSQKIAFFTDKIGLTPEEAQLFWPVYNSYWEAKDKIIEDRKQKMTYFSQNCDNMTEKEMIVYANQYINFELQLAQLFEDYNTKFKEILPIKKVLKLYLADYEFKTYLLKKIRGSNKNTEE